ncbi:MAG: LysR family transcriptional regulator [Pseudomonadota bacterium]
MALDLDDLALLVRAAGAPSLAQAAEQLGITPQIASRRLARLEAALGVRLMQRTTRSLALTFEGEAFLPHARQVIEAAEAAQAAVGGDRSPRGHLRVTAPVSFGHQVLSPLAAQLLAEHRDLRLDLHLSDDVIDLVERGIDVAVRIAPGRSGPHPARRVASNPLALVAAPGYLADRGTPRRLADLADHSCLRRTSAPSWSFLRSDGAPVNVTVEGALVSNANEALRDGVVAGLGLGLHSLWDVGDLIAAGALVRVDLSDAAPLPLSIWLVRPTGARTLGANVAAFSELLAATCRDLEQQL